MELTNLNLFLTTFFILLLAFSINRVIKIKKETNKISKPYIIAATILGFLILFQPLKFSTSPQIEQTRASFNSTLKEEKEIVKSVDQRHYSQNRETQKEQAEQEFKKEGQK